MTNDIDNALDRTAPAKVAQTSREDILAHMKWSKPVEWNTKQGPRMLRKARPITEFFELWRSDRLWLRTNGYVLAEDKGKWIVMHYVLEGSLDARMAKILIDKQQIIEAALDTPQ